MTDAPQGPDRHSAIDAQKKENLATGGADYHRYPKRVQEIRATADGKRRDLARAYSPGVAEACLEIKNNPAAALEYTARGNLVAVVTTRQFWFGNIPTGVKAGHGRKGEPVQEIANIDCFDIELNEPDPEKLADIVCALEPTFGSDQPEDIKAPDCFIVEKICRERMNIPVFHDDQ
jgi:malate dehydrogenase (oxaloacetate-decarboxylating)(NADP+)